MNRKQIICLWIGISIIVLMGIFPPWIYVKQWYGGVETFVLYHFILTPPHPNIHDNNALPGVRIYTAQLCFQWVIVAVLTGGFIITFRDR